MLPIINYRNAVVFAKKIKSRSIEIRVSAQVKSYCLRRTLSVAQSRGGDGHGGAATEGRGGCEHDKMIIY